MERERREIEEKLFENGYRTFRGKQAEIPPSGNAHLSCASLVYK